VTQQNAALVEEAAAAAGSLEEQSAALAKLVSRFVVHGVAVTPVLTPVPRQVMSAKVRVIAPRAVAAAPAPRALPARAAKVQEAEWETF
jgi:methyl-accepting chemotaxis protein